MLAGEGVGYFSGVNSAPNTSSKSSCGASDTTFTTDFYYSVSINYSGLWNLAYWSTNGTITPDNYTHCIVKGNLNGSGDYEKTVVTHGVGMWKMHSAQGQLKWNHRISH